MRINHNMNAISIFFNQSKVESDRSKALERISTGYKINGAGDNPAGLASSETMRMEIRTLNMVSRNVQDGVSMLQTAEGGMESIHDSLQRLRELVVSSGDASKNGDDQGAIQTEIAQLKKGINDATSNTTFNDISVIGKNGSVRMTIGGNAGECVDFSTYDLSCGSIGQVDGNGKLISGKSINDIDLNGKSLDENLKIIDDAMKTVSDCSSKYGALENRFSDTINNLTSFSQVTQTAESQIRDSDIGKEMMNYTKDSVLADAGNAILAQANKFPQDILNILSSLRTK